MTANRTKSFGKELRAWRKARRLSQVEAANELKVSRSTLQNWEQGYRKPRGSALRELIEKIERIT